VAKLYQAEHAAQKARREAEGYGEKEEEEEDIEVPPTTLRQGTRERSCPFRGG